MIMNMPHVYKANITRFNVAFSPDSAGSQNTKRDKPGRKQKSVHCESNLVIVVTSLHGSLKGAVSTMGVNCPNSKYTNR